MQKQRSFLVERCTCSKILRRSRRFLYGIFPKIKNIFILNKNELPGAMWVRSEYSRCRKIYLFFRSVRIQSSDEKMSHWPFGYGHIPDRGTGNLTVGSPVQKIAQLSETTISDNTTGRL